MYGDTKLTILSYIIIAMDKIINIKNRYMESINKSITLKRPNIKTSQ